MSKAQDQHGKLRVAQDRFLPQRASELAIFGELVTTRVDGIFVRVV